MRIPGIIADENLTLVLGIAMNIHVNTAAVATKGRKRNINLRMGSIPSNTGAKISVEFKKMDIPDVTTTNTGTNNSVIT
jgi:hypothetical protein